MHTLRSPWVDELLDAPYLLDTLMDHIPDQIYFKDAKSRFVRISRALASRWGLDDPADAVGKTDFDFFAHEHAQKAFADEQRLLQTGEQLVGIEERETWQDGREAWVSTTKVPLRDRSGRIVGLFGISRDITGNKLAELRLAELRESQRRESLGVLAGGIAHDFNNLLVGIIGNADLLARDLVESPQAQMAAQIELAGRRAADLTRQMLAYSGKGKFVVEPLSLSELVGELLPLLESVISKKAELTVSCPDGLRTMQGDATQIRQVVMNLLTNASDALDEHSGRISVTVGEVEADADYLSQFAFAKSELAAGLYAFVEVSDTGRGMDTQTRERIFDPYFTTKLTGSGLGLAAVRGIVEGHDGGLRMYSEPGTGSSFKVLFPASGGKSQASRRSTDSNAAGKPRRARRRRRRLRTHDHSKDARSFRLHRDGSLRWNRRGQHFPERTKTVRLRHSRSDDARLQRRRSIRPDTTDPPRHTDRDLQRLQRPGGAHTLRRNRINRLPTETLRARRTGRRAHRSHTPERHGSDDNTRSRLKRKLRGVQGLRAREPAAVAA